MQKSQTCIPDVNCETGKSCFGSQIDDGNKTKNQLGQSGVRLALAKKKPKLGAQLTE